jgi:RNA polymerase sigma-70 factor (ECF subfamily)
MTDRTNEEWLAHLQSEDKAIRAPALEDLRERLRRGLHFYLSRERSDLADRPHEDVQQMAEDFAQDALLKVLDNLDSFRGESRFTTWASKIAMRVAISELRRVRWKDYSLETVTAEGEYMPRTTAMPASPSQPLGPEEATERGDVMQIIEEAIAEALTDRQRAAIVASALEGVPLQEVARMLDTNTNALYKLIHDARLKLRRYLEAKGVTMDYVMDLFGSQ